VGRLPYLRSLRILIVTPSPRPEPTAETVWTGNRVTSQRWARMLRGLGHPVRVTPAYRGEDCDLLVALHARKSFPSIRRFRREHPRAPLVVVLTGTDLYGDLRRSARARRSLELATRIIVLQPLAIRAVPARYRGRVRVIRQSADRLPGRIARRKDVFEVCVLANLRPVKDPLRIAVAARLLPAGSCIAVLHVGAALDGRLRACARKESASNPRYRWLGAVPRYRALRILARSRLLVLTSRLEGGANVLSEALAASVPVISSRVAGSIGILGTDYPGYFPIGDTRALATLLRRAEADPAFYARLQRWCRRKRFLVAPARERQAWARVLRDVEPPSGGE
jgi:putative glycosyltransferase (TIGR04348 family)